MTVGIIFIDVSIFFGRFGDTVEGDPATPAGIASILTSAHGSRHKE